MAVVRGVAPACPRCGEDGGGSPPSDGDDGEVLCGRGRARGGWGIPVELVLRRGEERQRGAARGLSKGENGVRCLWGGCRWSRVVRWGEVMAGAERGGSCTLAPVSSKARAAVQRGEEGNGGSRCGGARLK